MLMCTNLSSRGLWPRLVKPWLGSSEAIPRTIQTIRGSLVEHEVSRLAGLIDPANVVYGGKSVPATRYLDPTILYPVFWEDEIMKDEVFGPVLPIISYK